ncbi:helix-turn-helix domain-containing protein [Endobacterium cereale]|nr:AraC family transcriptional regulator [Endobacterium cereale]MEB2847952.1 AraC family transcriptional regulator [Endobacterium cereale]
MRKDTTASKNPADESTDSYGCPFDKLYKNQMIRGAGLTVLRKGSRDAFLQQVESPASDRGFVVGVSTLPGHTRRIFHAHHVTTHVFLHDTVYIRGLAEDYKADLDGPFDFLLLELSHSSLETIAQEADLPTISALKTITAQPDPVLANLARALIPALDHPEEASKLFVDQLTAAIGTHVVQQYGDRSLVRASKPRRLSRLQENTAKSMILENLQGAVSVAELAQACNLSRGYFIHAFRETTGMTPYQWLLRERISRARTLLLASDASLSDVAIACGFSDQSHFTRVFSTVVGVTPGTWRRTS